jgi:NADPH:quinone reductase-like Zn-dependent oxidoreductase
MQAVRVAREGDSSSVLELIEQSVPTLSEPFDILVRIKGIALNPVDTKARMASSGQSFYIRSDLS